MILFLLLLIGQSISNNSQNIISTECSRFNIKIIHDFVYNYTKLYFENFHKYQHLDVKCEHTAYNMTDMREVNFVPVNYLLIDSTFALQNMLTTDQISKITLLGFSYVSGIDINFTIVPIKNLKYINIILQYAKLDFFHNKTKLDKVEQCHLNTYIQSKFFFQPFNSLLFDKVAYPSSLCPLIFLRSRANFISFGDITNSFMLKNPLYFTQIETFLPETQFYLNDLNTLKLDIYYENLSRATLDPHIFGHAKHIWLNGVLNGIESDAFKGFNRLECLELQLDNLKEFFHRFNIRWMDNLNRADEVTFSMRRIVLLKLFAKFSSVRLNQVYTYPNEDICLFKDFPHSRLVYPIILPGKKLKCTCTLKWLQRFSTHLADYEYEYLTSDLKYAMFKANLNFCNNSQITCDFPHIFSNCKNASLSPTNGLTFTNEVDISFLIKWFQFILLIVLQPMFAFMGLLNNLFVFILVTNKKHTKLFVDPMYSHIKINAIFNMLYCAIMSFSLINMCLFFNSQIFCSSLSQTHSAQYFKIVGIHFFGNIFKTCSNVSYLMFTLSRFILVGNLKEKKFIKKFNKMNLKVYAVVLMCASILISIYKLFQYDVNVEMDMDKDFPYEIHNELKCLGNHAICVTFKTFKIFDKALNDICFFCLIFIFDALLLKYFDRELTHKIKMREKNADNSDLVKIRKNTNRMIIFNGLLFLGSHLPECLSTILLIAYSKKIIYFCSNTIYTCDLINEETQFFGFVSITCQLYIFLGFNKNFQISKNDLLKRFRQSLFKFRLKIQEKCSKNNIISDGSLQNYAMYSQRY